MMHLPSFLSLSCAALVAVVVTGISPTAARAQSPTPGSAGTTGTQGAVLQIGDERTTGSPGAEVAVIEFGDFQCGYCGDFFKNAGDKLRETFVESGRVRFAYRHFPLPMHEHALEAAKAAQCAARQGQFWEMHDLLFRNQDNLAAPNLKELARKAGLNMEKFESCLTSEATLDTIKADMEKAKELGVRATPTIVIGTVQPDGTVRTEKTIPGAQPFSVYEQAVNDVLKSSGAEGGPDPAP